MSERSQRRPLRERGIYVPATEVLTYLANGWRLLDDAPGYAEVLMAPPQPDRNEDRAA